MAAYLLSEIDTTFGIAVPRARRSRRFWSVPGWRFQLLQVVSARTKIYAGTPVDRPPRTLVLHQDWALRQLNKIEMPEEHRAMILGLNMAKLCKVDVESLLRKAQDKRYGPQIPCDDVPIDMSWDAAPATKAE